MRPLIGITCSRRVGGAWGLYSPGHMMDYTFDDYSRSVLDCGASPVLLPIAQTDDSIEALLDQVAGLILSGGPDLHPRFYGESPQVNLGEVDEELDRIELAFARRGIEKDLPVFGICRGIQVLNVSLGGTLYQDITSQVPDAIGHQQKAAKFTNSHRIVLQPQSLLGGILGQQSIWVNGKHHQAIKDPAPDLAIDALAPDGVVEAVHHPGKRFVLGVQWHPEGTFKNDVHSHQLFRSFVDACRNYALET